MKWIACLLVLAASAAGAGPLHRGDLLVLSYTGAIVAVDPAGVRER
jgi:hypothetical protein